MANFKYFLSLVLENGDYVASSSISLGGVEDGDELPAVAAQFIEPAIELLCVSFAAQKARCRQFYGFIFPPHSIFPPRSTKWGQSQLPNLQPATLPSCEMTTACGSASLRGYGRQVNGRLNRGPPRIRILFACRSYILPTGAR